MSLAGSAFGADTLADDVLNNLSIMRSVYRSEYAPAAWKKQYAGWDLETEYAKAVAAVRAKPNLTIADSREIFKDFIYSMKDYHTSIKFASTETATLPFTAIEGGGRVFIAEVDRTKLSEDAFPFKAGDEIVTFGGQPVAKAVDELEKQVIANVPATDRALAVSRLTSRSMNRGILVPQGPVVIGIRPQGETAVKHVQLIWDHTPEKINPRGDLFSDGFSRASIFKPTMNVDLLEDKKPVPTSPFAMGAKKSYIPALGPKVWESADDGIFHAYIYKAADRRLIGYVRIPGYIVEDYVKAIAEFAKVIERFENTTDAMVIDQIDNPGGSVFYLYGLASMLTDKPLLTPRHRMSITQNDVVEAVNIVQKLQDVKNDEDAKKAIPASELDGYPASYEFARFTLGYAQFLVNEWNSGRKLTAPYWIGGVDHINPAKARYTKPILVVVNQLCFSGGDFFPTILQDNKRVTVFGSRTAGAGGYVLDVNVPNNVGVQTFRFTGSIAERVDGKPIENLGVTPDINYDLTAEDLTTNFAPYAKAIRTAVEGLR